MDRVERADDNSPELRPRETIGRVNNVGRFRLLADLEPIEVTFLLLAFVSIVGACFITIVRVHDSLSFKNEADFTFGVLLLINLVFVLYYTIHGVFCERPFELLVSVTATVIVLLYCIIEYAMNGHKAFDTTKDLKLGRLIVVCVLGPVDIVLGSIIAGKFFRSRRLIFRTVGGNAALQNMCQTMFFFTAFLKFDFQLVISLLVLVLNGGAATLVLSQKLILGIGVPISFGWVILGFFMVRYEKMKLSSTFWLLGLLLPAYIVYLFFRNEEHPNNPFLFPTTIAAGVIGLLVRTCTMILSYLVTRNFNKGLKEKVFRVNEEDQGTSTS